MRPNNSIKPTWLRHAAYFWRSADWENMKRIGEHTWQTTAPTEIEIGKPASPPSQKAIAAIRAAVADSGAAKIYWFWMSIDGDQPHLGLGVGPNDNDIVARVGQAVEPIWNQYSADNPVFDILRLGDTELDQIIQREGQLLYPASPESKKTWWKLWQK